MKFPETQIQTSKVQAQEHTWGKLFTEPAIPLGYNLQFHKDYHELVLYTSAGLWLHLNLSVVYDSRALVTIACWFQTPKRGNSQETSGPLGQGKDRPKSRGTVGLELWDLFSHRFLTKLQRKQRWHTSIFPWSRSFSCQIFIQR